MAKTKMKWWIKERYNPQLGTYYVACGQISNTSARQHERPIYGDNVMHSYDTEASYRQRLAELKSKGERVQGDS